MNVQVWPIAATICNWPVLLKEAEILLGYSLERPIQLSAYSLVELPTFIIGLGELEEEGSTKNRIPDHNQRLLSHAMLSFLVYAEQETFIEFFEKVTLTITRSRSGRVAIMSGTLDQWADVILRPTYVRPESVTVVEKIYQYIIVMKLKDIL